MSYEEISAKHVSGKKEYRCEWCNEAIPKGEKHLSRAYRFEATFTAGRMHLDCETAMDKSDRALLSEGFYPGECKRGEVLT